MTITISISADSGSAARQELSALLGGTALLSGNVDLPATAEDEAGGTDSLATPVVSDLSDTPAATPAPQRDRGKPAAGRARRTKEEIAEDEEADRRDAALAQAGTETGAVVQDRQISTSPEDRRDPDNPADAAQDAADEAAETASAKAASGKKLTHDDVRSALGAYVKAYGMAAAQEDGPKVIALMFGAGSSKVSDIPDTPEALAKAVAGVEEMTRKNPYERAPNL